MRACFTVQVFGEFDMSVVARLVNESPTEDIRARRAGTRTDEPLDDIRMAKGHGKRKCSASSFVGVHKHSIVESPQALAHRQVAARHCVVKTTQDVWHFHHGWTTGATVATAARMVARISPLSQPRLRKDGVAGRESRNTAGEQLP